MECAERLFARDGIDATTMALIASEAEVSPPTVFNYFGSKENILSALIFEGTQREREQHLSRPRKTDCSFAEVLGDLLCECTENTMRIAGRRVWRYAEAANIRRPNTEFEKQFMHSDEELQNLIAVFLGEYEMQLRNGSSPDPHFLATLFLDRWTAHYFTFIKDESMTVETHEKSLRADVTPMVSLIFDDDFAAHSPLKTSEIAQ
ncbi:MAG: TetR/AcrR family transcriptional regulator [Rhodobacteraceae bacterium]|nr:TetR/AcrR family transcriptional regulator [Paracoccaceae bacterium]